MKFASVRDLKNHTSAMLRIARKGKDVLITSHGKPVAVIHGIDEEGLEDYILSRHPGIRRSIEAADREYKKKGGVPLAEFRRKLKAGTRSGKRRGKVRR